jgi:hypothetical protein
LILYKDNYFPNEQCAPAYDILFKKYGIGYNYHRNGYHRQAALYDLCPTKSNQIKYQK